MPIRPAQHRLEDKSRIKLQNILPEMWVYRDKDKDYGIDAEIELFGTDEKAQGIVFWVQIKATKSNKKITILNVDIDIETLKYYNSLDIPVLLVRYSNFEDILYVKWIDNVDLFSAKKGAKTFRIKLNENNKWNENTFIEIEKYLIRIKKLKSGNFSFPLSLDISITNDKINGFSRGILLNQLRKELKQYPDFISIQNNAIINVTLDNEELKIDFSNVSGCSFHNIELLNKDNFSENLSKDILLGIAISLIKLGQIEYCGRLIFENNLKDRLLKKKELIEYLIIPLFHSSFFNEAILIFEEILKEEDYFGLSIISRFHMLLVSNTKNIAKNSAIENFLKREIVRANTISDEQIGIANYNLANFYRCSNKFLEAIHNFNLARKFAPIYLKQAYFYSEIASIFFLNGKFKLASKYYLKSLNIEKNNHKLALYADSLMLSGEYEEANKKFDEYIENDENPREEFVLKNIILELLLKKYNIKKQERKIEEANFYADITNVKIKNINTNLEKALELDLLSSLAWFNLGIIHSENNEYYQAMICFTITALVNNNDIEAWKNATFTSLNSQTGINLLPLIILTAYSFNKEDYLEELYINFEMQGNSENLNLFSEIINSILPKESNIIKPTLRLFNGKDKFENIDDLITEHNNPNL